MAAKPLSTISAISLAVAKGREHKHLQQIKTAKRKRRRGKKRRWRDGYEKGKYSVREEINLKNLLTLYDYSMK